MSSSRKVSSRLMVVLFLVGIVTFTIRKSVHRIVTNERPSHIGGAPDNATIETPSSHSSPACALNHQRLVGETGYRVEKIVLLHMRKAGGSSMRRYFTRVARKHNVSLAAYEGAFPMIPEDAPKGTLLVTHIREPIARVISNYKYDLRWNCRTLVSRSATFVPTINNTQMSLESFVDHQNIPNGPSNLGKLWECSHNCYSKWATGLCWDERISDEFCSSQNDTRGPLISRAREVLYQYNLIIVIEWLQNPEYVRYIEGLFGVSDLAEPVSMWCGKESAEANKMVPLVVSEELQHRLSEVNQLDSALYREFTNCPSFKFPNHSIFEKS